MEGVNADVEVVGVVQVDDWVLVVAPSVAGSADELVAPLSVGGEVLAFATQVGRSNFAQWVDGVRTAMFDALLKDGPGFDAPDSPWRDRMREVGADPDSEGPMPDGLFHTLEILLAMIVDHTGVELTRELLRSAQFQIGDSLEQWRSTPGVARSTKESSAQRPSTPSNGPPECPTVSGHSSADTSR